MSNIININFGSAISQSPASLRGSVPVQAPQPQAFPRDTVEFSQRSESLAAAADLSSFRIARIRAISAEITAGTYETQQRIEATVSRILDVVG